MAIQKKTIRKKASKKKPAATIRRKPNLKKVARKNKPPKRTPTRKAAKKTAKNAGVQKPFGRVTHFYGGIKVAIVKFSKPVRQGTFARFKGKTTDFAQKLDSIQYDHKAIATAPKGKLIGVKVKSRVREGDQIYPA